MSRGSRARSVGGVVLLASICAVAPAWSQAPSAKDAYEAATAAFAAKHYAEAAAGFARADALSPNAIALESALKAVLLADDPILGMELVTRAEARPADPRIDPLEARARTAFEKRVGRVELRCGANKTCFARLDPGGRALETGQPIWVPVGQAAATITSDTGASTTTISVEPGALVIVQAPQVAAPAPPSPPAESPPVAAPPPPTAPPPSSSAPPGLPPAPRPVDASGGISPVWFAIGAVATGGLAAGTIASGVDTLGLHDDYLAGDDAALDSGQSAQLRTNVLLGVTLAAAAATTVLAIVTDWGGADLAVAPGGAQARLRF